MLLLFRQLEGKVNEKEDWRMNGLRYWRGKSFHGNVPLLWFCFYSNRQPPSLELLMEPIVLYLAASCILCLWIWCFVYTWNPTCQPTGCYLRRHRGHNFAKLACGVDYDHEGCFLPLSADQHVTGMNKEGEKWTTIPLGLSLSASSASKSIT